MYGNHRGPFQHKFYQWILTAKILAIRDYSPVVRKKVYLLDKSTKLGMELP